MSDSQDIQRLSQAVEQLTATIATSQTERRYAYSISEAARMLGVEPRTVRKLIQHGQLKCRHVLGGRKILVTAASLERFGGYKPGTTTGVMEKKEP